MRELSLPPTPAVAATSGAASERNQRHTWRLLRSLLVLGLDFQPLRLLGAFAAGFFLLGVLVGCSSLHHLGDKHHQISHVTQAVLAGGLLVSALFSLQAGVILESRLRHDRSNLQLRIRCSRRSDTKPAVTEENSGSRSRV